MGGTGKQIRTGLMGGICPRVLPPVELRLRVLRPGVLQPSNAGNLLRRGGIRTSTSRIRTKMIA